MNDRSWIPNDRSGADYLNGVICFINFARANNAVNEERLRCPCVRCNNCLLQTFGTAIDHMDRNRYNAGRGAHLTLKRAEKARATVNKLPAMVESLVVDTSSWKRERGTEFTYDGVCDHKNEACLQPAIMVLILSVKVMEWKVMKLEQMHVQENAD